MIHENMIEQPKMLIGYYPIRGKAQICRLLCEYLRIPYKDLLFTPNTWLEFKNTYNLNWTFQQLPFIKDGQRMVIQMYTMCLYLLHKTGRKDLLGSNLNQQIHTDMLLCDAQPISHTFTSIVNQRQLSTQIRKQSIQKLWQKIKNKLTKMQNQSKNNYYYGNLSLVDFYIYETIFTLNDFCPEKLKDFPKLYNVFQTISNLPPIKDYQESSRAIKQVCPINFSLKLKERVRERGKTF